MKQELEEQGYCIIKEVFTPAEINHIASLIEQAEGATASFRKTEDLFAIRRFLQEVPGITASLFTPRFKSILAQFGGADYFISKSIYFDKPELSNWFVAYHQDLTIAVDRKVAIPGYGPWSRKQEQYAVQPLVALLENNFTIRIHLDDTDESNGALKVIPASHRKGIYRPETVDWSVEEEGICCVPAGGIMLMKPLLLHASARSSGHKRRRVMHLEFSKAALPAGLNWSQKTTI